MNFFTRPVLIFVAMVLASCSDPSPVSTNSGNVKVAKPMQLDGDMVVDLRANPERLISNSTIIASSVAEGVRVSGTKAQANSGSKTGGAYIEIGADLEKMFAEHTIRVSLVARSTEAGGMKVAYSTADKGNSGWQSFSLTPSLETYEFDYKVPAVIAGRNDFIGILPVSSAVEVSLISVLIVK